MKRRLHELGITSLFAVQTAVLPLLLGSCKLHRRLYLPYDPPQDICVSAPTGSGKTLAYALPIIEILAARKITRLRAVVVLPTRDLVTQVRKTFEVLSRGYGLKIGSATGQHSFSYEQRALVSELQSMCRGGSSRVDILICTPGRLIDHLEATRNFSLQHLRFLVIDEADRLLAESFQGWLERVMTVLDSVDCLGDQDVTDLYYSISGAESIAPMHMPKLDSDLSTAVMQPQHSCQKLLFSATLPRNPGVMNRLQLRRTRYLVIQYPNPIHYTIDADQVQMPEHLEQRYVVTETALKPLTLFCLIKAFKINQALIFTKSTEAASQLAALLNSLLRADESVKLEDRCVHLRGASVAAISSDRGVNDRKSVLRSFALGNLSLLVCSDLIARGLDIPLIEHVISYDVPLELSRYVHRAGRTARAGRHGVAWTLVEEQEVWHFKSLLRSGLLLDQVTKMRVLDNDMATLLPLYKSILPQPTTLRDDGWTS